MFTSHLLLSPSSLPRSGEMCKRVTSDPAENVSCYVSHRGKEQMDAVLFSGLGPRWLTFLAGSGELMTERN